jgi:hypothetical protein
MIKLLFVVLICIMLFSGCAAGPNPLKGKPMDSADKPAGFWRGLWHGIIAVIAFIVSWFKPSVSIYEVHNNGFWYNLGFLIGISGSFGGGVGGGLSRQRRKG